MTYNFNNKRVLVAGSRGMVGQALMRRLEQENCEILTLQRQQADLTRQAETEDWMAAHKPDAVFIAAARVGGIKANNDYPADFLYDNLMIASNLIHAAYLNKVEKLMFLGSSCIYPRATQQPMKEESLLTGPLEPTNQWYAVAKIAGIKLCQAYRRQYGSDYISVMPTNLYGPGDNYDPETSHVPAALIQRFHKARQNGDSRVEVWGSGQPLREFMHVDDLADACVFLMQHYSDEQIVNAGTGEEVSIADFARTVADTVGYTGELVFNTDKPDGVPRKLMDSARLRAMGWSPAISLHDGLKDAYRAYLRDHADMAAE